MSRKNDPEFMKLLDECTTLDRETGKLTFTNIYVHECLNITFKGEVIVIPTAHVVWFKDRKRWPQAGWHLDHINDNPQDHRPDNLQEVTQQENQAKRRGRMVYRNYGSGKYGHGFNILQDKRDGRFYIRRYLSRGHGDGDLKTIKRGLGGFDSLEAAEKKVKEYIAQIEANGSDYLPDYADKTPRKVTAQLDASLEEIRALRESGRTIKEIAELTGLKEGAIYNRIRDLGVDQRVGRPEKLDADKVKQIRAMAAEGKTLKSIGLEFGVSTAMISNIIRRKAWTQIE